MANQKHVALLRRGVEVWNQWRKEHKSILPDLSEANLRNANLEGADLSGADLCGTNLTKTNLKGANLHETDLSIAKIQGADLQGVNVSGAHLEGANLEGANLSEAHLQGAHLEGARLRGANFRGANLLGVHLQGAKLQETDLQETDLQQAHLQQAHLQQAIFWGANLSGANLQRAHLQGANVCGSILRGANLSYTDLGDMDFSGMDLTGTDVCGTNLSGTNLRGANLSKTDLGNRNFSGFDLSGTNLSDCNLLGTPVEGANLQGANLSKTDLRNRDFSGMDFSGTNLCGSNLQGANLDGTTLRGANLSHTDLSNRDFSQMDFSGTNLNGTDLSAGKLYKADLSQSDLRRSNLIDSDLDEATLTGTRLWETQLSGWSIKNVICEYVYWDREGKIPTYYAPGEFEGRYSVSENEEMPDELPRQSSIFLSHSHADKPFAQKLASDIRRHGHKVWIDEAEIQLGDSLIEKIRQGLDEVDHVAAILSKASINSRWVQKELDIAMNREIEHKRVVVLPLLLEDVELPGFLKGKMYADFRDHGQYSEGLSLLLRRLGTNVTSGQVPATIVESDGQPENQRQPVSTAPDENLRHKTEPPAIMQKKTPPNTVINIERIGTLGSIGDISDNATVHIDQSLRPASTQTGRKSSPKDVELFERLLDLLPSTSIVRFYKEHNFLATFEKQFVDPLYEFIENWDNPEHEFLDKELGKARCELYESAKALGTTIANNTVPNRAGQISVKPDSLPSGETPAWVRRDAQEINDLAPPFVEKHVLFVRLGRRRLYG